MNKTRVTTDGAPAPAHTFSQGVCKGPIGHVSGQGPVDPTSNDTCSPETLQRRPRALCGTCWQSWKPQVPRSTMSWCCGPNLTKHEDFALMNDAYGEFVTMHTPSGVLPSRTTVFTRLPGEEMLVEIDALALVDG